MDKIVKAIPLDNHLIEIQTSNGISGIFDVKPYLGGSAFKELLNESYFRRVRPAHHGIAWPHKQDFSADTIIWDITRRRSGQPTPCPLTPPPATPPTASYQPATTAPGASTTAKVDPENRTVF